MAGWIGPMSPICKSLPYIFGQNEHQRQREGHIKSFLLWRMTLSVFLSSCPEIFRHLFKVLFETEFLFCTFIFVTINIILYLI